MAHASVPLNASGDDPTVCLPATLREALRWYEEWVSQTPHLFCSKSQSGEAHGLSIEAVKQRVSRLGTFLESTPRPFDRHTWPGHVTGSAVLVDASWRFLCLLHHAKLGLWLQPGGHSDGCEKTWEVALREATEESGLSGLRLESFCPSGRVFPLDVDIHTFPARGSEPEHLHYDLRFLVVTPFDAESTILPGNEESHAIAWFPIRDWAMPVSQVHGVSGVPTDDSVNRLFALVSFLKKSSQQEGLPL